MDRVDDLKRLIADVLKVNPADINENYIIKTGKLNTSAGKVIIANIVKKVYGQKVDCSSAKTFGDLIAIINGKDTVVEPDFNISNKNIGEPKAKEYSTDSEFSTVTGVPVCGIDIQEIDTFPESEDYWTESFYTENFTKEEIAYCVTADSPRHSFVARWCVKEALHKISPVYYDIPFQDIQIVKRPNGSICIEIRRYDGEWQIIPFSCSISHAENYAVGMVIGLEGR